MSDERIEGVGYINHLGRHAMVSISNPTMLNAETEDFVQVVVTIENAVKLRDKLDEFLSAHYSGDEQ